MPKLKALSKDEDLNAIPIDEPVLVELEPAPTGTEDDGGEIEAKPAKKERQIKADPDADGADAGVKALQEQMAEMDRASKAEIARLAKEAEDARREAAEARGAQIETEGDLIANGLKAAQRDRDAARAAVKTSLENSDAEGLADAQEKLARAAADIRDYERAAAEQADRVERDKADRERQPERKPAGDINATIEAMAILPKEKEWLKEHPDVLMDAGRKTELDAAYIRATRKGLIRGTPAYFKFMNTELGYEEAAGADPDDNDERTITVSAPVSREVRSAATGQRANPNQIRLEPAERDIARSMGLTDAQYARGKVQLAAAKAADPEKYGRVR